jgi:hypothetical protein
LKHGIIILADVERLAHHSGIGGKSRSAIVSIIAVGRNHLLSEGIVIASGLDAIFGGIAGAGKVPTFQAVDALFGFQFPRPLGDPVLEAESKPLL